MPLLLLDLDGTLREPLSGQRYFQHPRDQQIIAGVDIALQAYSDQWIMIGITNQGGVAAGHKSIQSCIEEQQYILELLPQLREVYFCPDFEGRKCFRVTRHNFYNHSKTHWSGQYRKPGAGMLNLAMVRHKHTPAGTWYVGDRPEDEAAARRAKVSFQWAEQWISFHPAPCQAVE
ncbi:MULTISPECIES: HAD-IIIA family hydrolase [unclassified Leptolyngbya]|uniref:HAD-IIIA family hydrolase n=1 Tax=unclassified Leptolyngbya TaxID=2650499 RepID=UPI001688C1D8|nr:MULTISPECIES: HAD-IIIA family hydrolase [unclassified Leptolyngbya]MBD1909399.1 HAD-IIIA family hydrolase [Leptolyngbya sp. FACHB-8]MBD2157116.1 HAD-IIIA family hydrolase [Leptolyngbya sp. FACHB-16]